MRSMRIHPHGRLATVAALVVVLAVALMAAGAGGRPWGGSGTFNDTAGDGHGNSPDVTTVVVTNDDAGRITIRATIGNRQALDAYDLVALFLDADHNPATGRYGDEAVIYKTGFGAGVDRWSGYQWYAAAVPSLALAFETSQFVVSFDRSDLEVTDGFSFSYTTTSLAVPEELYDDAPDYGAWTYMLGFTPTGGKTIFSPNPPRAGRMTVVALPVTADGRPVAEATVTAKGVLGTKAVRPSSTAFVDSIATTTWRLPKAARGKVFKGSITVTTAGGSVTKTFKTKVK